jgi:hypothetical protein
VGVGGRIQAGPVPPFVGQSGGHGRRGPVVVGRGVQAGPVPPYLGQSRGHRGGVSVSGTGEAITAAMKAARTVMMKLFIAVLKS